VIRLSWLQFRTQAMAAAAGLAVIAVVVAITGPHLADYYRTAVATCKAPPPWQEVFPFIKHPHEPFPPNNCQRLVAAWRGRYNILQQSLSAIVLVIPALTGLFWGAPLAARELETGAFRLAWTQSVTRARWLAVKLTLVGLSSMAVAGLLSLMVTWWSSPLDKTYASQFNAFSERGIVPVGYAAFGFVLGVTAGLLIRRTLPAMAATVLPYIGARFAVTALRPHFISPVTVADKLPHDLNVFQVGLDSWPTYWSGNWVIASNTIRLTTTVPPITQGNLVTCPASQYLQPHSHSHPSSVPPPLAIESGAMKSCVEHHTYPYLAQLREILTYQPGSRYWAFQGIETGIFLALAAALAVACFWWLRRRIC
jgi:hypothetical protein